MPQLVDLLRKRAETEPTRVHHVIFREGHAEGEPLPCGDLDRRARAVAVRLREAGVKPGDRVVILYPQGLEFVVAFFGCLYAGAIAVPVLPMRPNRSSGRLEAILSDAGPAAILASPALVQPGESLRSPRCLDVAAMPASLAGHWRAPPLRGSSLALLQYTSGSTSAPRGVRVTHANILSNQAVLRQAMGITAASRGVSWVPPHHDMGLMSGVVMPVYAGGVMALMSPLTFLQQPVTWLETIDRFRATHSGGPNFAYDLCLRRVKPAARERLSLSSWQVAFVGAEPVRSATLEQFAAAFAPAGFRRQAFFPCYGLAESVLFVTGPDEGTEPRLLTVDATCLEKNQAVPVPRGDPGSRTLVSCGRGTPGHRVLIVDPHTHQLCEEGAIGEIWLSGPSVADGYWGRPEELHRTFQATLAFSGCGPFLRTGDLGFLHGDELFITGRMKDLIIIRGRNHYPQDIEQTVQHSHPALPPNANAAFSVEAEGEERLVIVQELPREARTWRQEEVALLIRQAVAEHHEVTAHAVVLLRPASIPKTTSGKIQRHQCRERFLAGTLESWESEGFRLSRSGV